MPKFVISSYRKTKKWNLRMLPNDENVEYLNCTNSELIILDKVIRTKDTIIECICAPFTGENDFINECHVFKNENYDVYYGHISQIYRHAADDIIDNNDSRFILQKSVKQFINRYRISCCNDNRTLMTFSIKMNLTTGPILNFLSHTTIAQGEYNAC